MIIGNAKVYIDGKFQAASVIIENDRITGLGEFGIPGDIDAAG